MTGGRAQVPALNGDLYLSQGGGTRSDELPDPLVGMKLDGRFEIESVLGSGGMSVVYKAKQINVNRYVAIKTIRMQLGRNSTARDRFQREVNTLCAMNHPHVVTVYDCLFGDDGAPFVVMDYLRGRSLDFLIAQDGPFSMDRFLNITLQVLSALDHAHANGVVHRDMKPGNIVLLDDQTDFVKVVDFGLAKVEEENRKLTQSGEILGSPPYMSPEQCLGKPGDIRSDVYSLGVVMYEMLTGMDPFNYVSSVFEMLQCHTSSIPPSMKDKNPDVSVPPVVEAVIFKAMEKDPSKRYQTIRELQDALVGACAGPVSKTSGDVALRAAASAASRATSSNPAAAPSPPAARGGEFNRARYATISDGQAPQKSSLGMGVLIGVVVAVVLLGGLGFFLLPKLTNTSAPTQPAAVTPAPTPATTTDTTPSSTPTKTPAAEPASSSPEPDDAKPTPVQSKSTSAVKPQIPPAKKVAKPVRHATVAPAPVPKPAKPAAKPAAKPKQFGQDLQNLRSSH